MTLILFFVKKMMSGLYFLLSALFCLMVPAGFAGWIFYLVHEIRRGRGLNYYFTGFGVKMNCVGVLSALAFIPVALLAGLIIRYWMGREEKDFLKKYGKKGDK